MESWLDSWSSILIKILQKLPMNASYYLTSSPSSLGTTKSSQIPVRDLKDRRDFKRRESWMASGIWKVHFSSYTFFKFIRIHILRGGWVFKESWIEYFLRSPTIFRMVCCLQVTLDQKQLASRLKLRMLRPSLHVLCKIWHLRMQKFACLKVDL